MRDIKFRGWNKQSHIMVNDIQIFAPRDTISLNSCFDDDMVVLPLQYTGLKDKNGVEIYEGDYLGIDDSEHKVVTDDGMGPDYDIQAQVVVKWHDELATFYCEITEDNITGDYINADELLTFQTISNLVGLEGLEVIGNIYENPELLK